MGDDGYGSVNLNFSFPYYDKTFNQAYMYDNGVLSFLQPGTPDALQQWQWNSQPLNQTQAKYFIAPLWADIAPVAQTQYLIDNQLTSAKFTWNNIAEYYSRGGILRLNSFSVEINNNGDISTKYFGLNLRTSNISIGYKGGSEYTQIAYNNYGYTLSNQADWTANTKTTAIAPIPTPIKQDPLPEPVIEQPVVQETVQQTPAPAPVVSTQATTTTAAPTANPTPVQATVVAEPVKTTEKKVAVKAQSVDMSVVDAAVAIAMTSASQSVNEQVVVSNNFSLSNSNTVNKQGNSQTTSQRQVTEQVDTTQQNTNNNEKKDALEFFVLNSLDKQDKQQEQKDKALNKGIKTVTELGPEIPLFSVYTLVYLPDGAMYVPKEIYKKQRVVDNQRLLRSLSNDRKYEDLINQQYTR